MSKARWLVLSEKAFFGRLRFFFSQKTGGPFCPDPLLGRKEGANEIKTYRGGPTPRQTALLFAQRLAKSRACGASGPGDTTTCLGKPWETAGRKAMGANVSSLPFPERRLCQPSR